MCNMAAYAGKGPAAPALLEMLKNQEGLWGGHFTGISTIHDGKVHTCRVCGDVAELLRKTAAADLPGSIGIAHSRSAGNIPSENWAHPFPVGDGELAYCANGIAGIFEGKQNYAGVCADLMKSGFDFGSVVNQASPAMPVLPDGRTVHASEVSSRVLYRAYAGGSGDLCTALEQMFGIVPAEIAALALSSREPDRVSALRFNQPLMWACTEESMLLASSAMGFPENLLVPASPVPMGCTLVMTCSGVSFRPMTSVGRLLHQDEGAGRVAALMEEKFADGKAYTAVELSIAARKLWPPEKACCYTHWVYTYLRENLMNGSLEKLEGCGTPSLPGGSVPEWRFRKRS